MAAEPDRIRAGDSGVGHNRLPVRLDPTLETAGLWQDFHTSFIISLRDSLRRALGDRYLTLAEERVYVAWEGAPLPSVHRRDISVATPGSPATATAGPSGSVATSPVMLVAVALPEEILQRFVAIRTPAGELVTVLEVLSPYNKRPGHEGRQNYLTKRQEFISAGIHLVEVDLLLGGERMPLAQPWPSCDRSVLVIRRHRPQAAELYPFSVRDPLPTIALPLRDPDGDHPLPLQAVLEEAWDRGGYDAVVAHLRGRSPQA